MKQNDAAEFREVTRYSFDFGWLEVDRSTFTALPLGEQAVP